MEKYDGRKRTPKNQYKIRKQVIHLRSQGISNQEVAKKVGISVSHASKIWQHYKKGGIKAIRSGKRGRRHGDKRTLSAAQEEKVHDLLISSVPDRLSAVPTLWTHEAVKRLIRKLCRVDMPMRTVREYLKRWGIAPQKPAKQVSQRNSPAMNQWLETEYPALVVRAKKEKAEILWGSEKEIETSTYAIRRSPSTGKRETVRLPLKKSRLTMVSAISNNGTIRFVMKKRFLQSILPFLFVFLRGLLADTDKKLYVILDNLRSYHNEDVNKLLEQYKGKIEVFHLPPKLKGPNSELC